MSAIIFYLFFFYFLSFEVAGKGVRPLGKTWHTPGIGVPLTPEFSGHGASGMVLGTFRPHQERPHSSCL